MYVLNRVNKKAIINMMIPTAIFLMILNSAAIFSLSFVPADELSLKIIILCGLAVVNLMFLASPFIRYHRYRYLLDDTRIVVREGIFFVSTTVAPIERIHQITVVSGPIDQLTGLAKVIVTTAGGEIDVRFLEKTVAAELAKKVEKAVKAIVKEQAGANEK